MSNGHPSHADFLRCQDSSPRHPIPLVMSQYGHNSAFPPAQAYDPTSSGSTFLDAHPLTYPPLATPGPSAQFPPQYPNTTVLQPAYHHPPLSPSPLSRLAQPALAISNSPPDAGIPRCAVAGSLDPTTGIFYRTPEPPRLRTAQACEKCRKRKAKCSGEHPACQRCLIRGLACIYAPEGRVRGSHKSRIRSFAVVPPRDSRSARRSKDTPPSSDTSSSSSTSSSSTASTFLENGISPASLVLGKLERNTAEDGSCRSSTTHTSPSAATPPTLTPTSSITPPLSPLSRLSPANAGDRVYISLNSSSLLSSCQNSFTEGNSSGLEYNFSMPYDPTSTPYLQDALPQADTTRLGDNVDMELGEYLDWTCPKDAKEHCDGDPGSFLLTSPWC